MLVLLVDQHFLFDPLLGFVDQALLQGFGLLLHLVDVGVSAVEVAATVHVQRVLELLRQSLDLELLFDQLALLVEDLVFVDRYFAALFHEDLEFALEIALFVLEETQVGHPFAEGRFAAGQGGLLDLYLLVKQG